MSYLFTVIFLCWVIARSTKIKFKKKRVKIESDLERPLLSKNSTKKCSIIKECSCHAMVKVSKSQMSFFLPSNTPRREIFGATSAMVGRIPPALASLTMIGIELRYQDAPVDTSLQSKKPKICFTLF